MLKEFVKTEQDAKNAIIGTIIADGCIQKNRSKKNIPNASASLEITHTSKNLDYLVQVGEILQCIEGMTYTIKEHNKTTLEKTYQLFRLGTNVHPYLAEVRDQIYSSSRIKKLPKEIVDQMSDLGLFLMYLDDGTLKVRFYEGTSKVREARVTFCLDSFTLTELQYLQKVLKTKYDIDTKVYRHSKNMPLDRGFRIWTNTENTKKLMKVFEKYYNHVPSMNYKFLQYYSL